MGVTHGCADRHKRLDRSLEQLFGSWFLTAISLQQIGVRYETITTINKKFSNKVTVFKAERERERKRERENAQRKNREETSINEPTRSHVI